MAIVVTYFPDASALGVLVNRLLHEADAVLLVDNTPDASNVVQRLCAQGHGVRVVALGENLGIASALNRGIEEALRGGFEYVLLCDQDSLPRAGMIETLVELADHLKGAGERVACISPEYVDLTTGMTARFDIWDAENHRYRRVDGAMAKPWVKICMTITSGSLIPCSVFTHVGLMRADFFIDHVDTEWCHRATHLGYNLYGTALTQLNHHLGDDRFRVWFFGWHIYTRYPPERLYYRFRNFIYMLRFTYVSGRWKVRQAWYWLGCVYAYVLFSEPRARNFQMILRGIRHGLSGRMGRMK